MAASSNADIFDDSSSQLELDPDIWQEFGRIYSSLSFVELLLGDKQPFLASRSYNLSSRSHPDWVPSWRTPRVDIWKCEGAVKLLAQSDIIDALRISDGKCVYIKQVKADSAELQIAQLLNSKRLLSDPRNHSVRLLDVIQDSEDPTVSYMVMPFLNRIDELPFVLVEELMEFCDQMLGGLVFLHEQGVTHRDCSTRNLMMDVAVLFSGLLHPVHLPFLYGGITPAPPPLLRLGRSIQYYDINFGYSVLIPPDVYPKLTLGNRGRDQELPELSKTVPYDPFKLDIFVIGNIFRRDFRDKYLNVRFLESMIEAMTRQDPATRPMRKKLSNCGEKFGEGCGRLRDYGG